MSGIGPTELIVLVVVGLLILGPERLPRVATQIGRWVGRARRTANQLRFQLEREITLADIESKKKKEKDEQAEGSADQSAPDNTGEPAAETVSDVAAGESGSESAPGADGPAEETAGAEVNKV